ncbi:MAG: hypothetical protein AAFV33_12985 [Chloroflexota bacterium]
MTDDLITLAQDMIAMRKNPLKNNAARRYPVAAQQFAQAVANCDDADTLRELIRLDSGHVLPPPTKQQIYEKLLAADANRTPDVLRAYGMHLVMFGYTDADGKLVHNTDELTNTLYAEADAKS